MSARLIPFAMLGAAPWKNGGGSTTEIAISPACAGFDDFDWRISLATIAHGGPFSVFPGIDRSLTLVAGEGVLLDIDGARTFALNAADPLIVFPGEARVAATVGQGETTDFNVMTRRAVCSHRLARRAVDGRCALPARTAAGATTVLFLAEGVSMTVDGAGGQLTLGRFDAAVLDAATSWTLAACGATVFVVDIFPN